MTRDSGFRLRTTPDFAVDLRVFVLSADASVGELVRSAAPAALRVDMITNRCRLERVLGTHPVVCALIVDMELPPLERVAMLALVQERWIGLPVFALARSASPGALERLYELTLHHAYKQAPIEAQRARVQLFLGPALDARLTWLARLLSHASDRGLTGATLETFVAHAICQVHRHELGDFLGLEEPAVQKRIRRLCALMGVGGRIAHITQLLLTLPPTPPRKSLVAGLEEQAAMVAARSRARALDPAAGE